MAQILHNNQFDFNKYPAEPYRLAEYFFKQNNPGQFVIIVPTGKMVRKINNDLIRDFFRITSRPCPKLNIFTLEQFIANCYQNFFNEKKYRIISDSYRLALFEEAIENSDLRYFAPKQKPGLSLISRLSQIIYGLKEDGISPEKIFDDIRKSENSPDHNFDIEKMTDIYNIYLNYNEYLSDRLLDFPAMLNNLNIFIDDNNAGQRISDELRLFDDFDIPGNVNENILNEIFPNKPVIILYGFNEFKMPEIEFISKFSSSIFPFSVHVDFSKINGPLFGNLEDMWIKLEAAGFSLKTLDKHDSLKIPEKSEFSSLPPVTFIRRWLFNTERNLNYPKLSRFINIISAPNRVEEVRNISRLVKYLIAAKNIKPSEICINTSSPEIYTGLFREIFRSSGIPVNISDRFALSASPLIVSIISIFKIYRDISKPVLNKLLNNSYFTLSENFTRFPANPSLVNRMISRLRLDSFSSGSLKSLIKSMRNALQRLDSYIQNEEFEDSQEEYAKKRFYQNLKESVSTLEILNESLPDLPAKLTVNQFIDIIKNDIVDNLNVYDNLTNKALEQLNRDSGREFYPDKDSAALNEFFRLIDEMSDVLNERFPGKTYSLNELLSRLETLVAGAKFQVKEKSGRGVAVTAIEQTRGIPYKVSILCGANDSIFPSVYRPENFLGKKLVKSEERHIRAERMDFYQFLTNGAEYYKKNEKLVYIFYSKFDESDRELLLSPFVNNILQISSLDEDGKVNEIDDIDFNPDWKDITVTLADFHKLAGHKAKNNIELSNDDYLIDPRGTQYIIDSCYGKNPEFVKLDKSSFPDEITNNPENKSGKAVSISELELYASCPYKYFASRILNIPEDEKEDSLLTPLEKGQLLHKVVYEFYTSARNDILDKDYSDVMIIPNDDTLPPLVPVRLLSEKKDEYLGKLRAITLKEYQAFPLNKNINQIELESFIGDDKNKGVLEKWLDAEILAFSVPDRPLPVMFEQAYGAAGSQIKAVEITEGLSVRGKIDRLDISFGSENSEFLVCDYKTNIETISSNTDILEGRSFQMPYYILAASAFLKEYYSIQSEPVGAVYIALNPVQENQDNIKSEKYVLTPLDSSFYNNFLHRVIKTKRGMPENRSHLNEILDNSVQLGLEHLQNIYSGVFPAKPAKSNTCKYCQFSSLCRIDDRK